MKRTMKQTIKLVHARYIVDLLQDPTKRGIGTNSVENRCKDICIDLPSRRRNTLIRRVMRWKLSDAKNCLRKARFSNTNKWRKYKAVLTDAGVLHDYERVWSLERKRVIGNLRVKR